MPHRATRRRWRAWIVALLLCAADARAEDAAPQSSLLDQVSAEAEFDELPSDFYEAVVGTELVACGDAIDCDEAVEFKRGRYGTFSVLTELTILVPSYSTENFQTKERPFVGPRVSLVWEAPSGFGVRGRGWGFDSATDAERNVPDNFVMTTDEVHFSGSRLDLDFYKRIPHSTGDFKIGAGVTAAHLSIRQRYTAVAQQAYTPWYYWEDVTTTQGGPGVGGDGVVDDLDASFLYYPVPVENEFDTRSLDDLESSQFDYNNGVIAATYQGGGTYRNLGAGIGLMMEGTHRLYATPIHVWTLFGRGRVAYLVGRLEAPLASGRDHGDSNMAIGEGALGLEYCRRFRRADIGLHSSFEVQSWDVSVVDRVNFAGVTTGLDVAW
jgi:hypothetical protein